MAYQLKRGESVAEGVRRIAGEELDSVVTQLGHAHGAKRDEAIHEARKGVKKIRATLRLVQSELGKSYRVESRVLRKAGRTLSELRDARSVIEILDQLREKYPGELGGSVVDPVRRGLLAKKKHAEEQEDVPATLRKIAANLRAAEKRVKKWPISAEGFPALERGLEASLRKGRAAFQLARTDPRPENYHDWRKRVKDHWYHVRLLENVWTEWMQGYEASLKELETWLGDDHNLVILRERLLADPSSFGPEKSMKAILPLIGKYQKELRANAGSYGERLYSEKPRHFVRRIHELWNAWQAAPKSLEDHEKAVQKAGSGVTG